MYSAIRVPTTSRRWARFKKVIIVNHVIALSANISSSSAFVFPHGTDKCWKNCPAPSLAISAILFHFHSAQNNSRSRSLQHHRLLRGGVKNPRRGNVSLGGGGGGHPPPPPPSSHLYYSHQRLVAKPLVYML